MPKSKWLRTVILAGLAMAIFVPAAQARLVVGSPENVISNSTLILLGTVIGGTETEEERTMTVLVERVLKGDYSEPEIVFTAKKNPIYGWTGHMQALPEPNTKLLLFLRNDEHGNPYFTFDLNCIAVVEGQRVVSLLGGHSITVGSITDDGSSNEAADEEHWEMADYIETYNEFLHSAETIRTQTEVASPADHGQYENLTHRSTAASATVFFPGILAFLIFVWFMGRS